MSRQTTADPSATGTGVASVPRFVRYNPQMGDEIATRTLWRPVGRNELHLIEQADCKAFPLRLPEQPIFYPVLNFEYAEPIARDWNSTDPRHANVGYVTEFAVKADFIDQYETHQVGARVHREYWIPAEDLVRFNDAIVGDIRVVATYRHGRRCE